MNAPALEPRDDEQLRRTAQLGLVRRYLPNSPVYVLTLGLLYLATPYPFEQPRVFAWIFGLTAFASVARLALALAFDRLYDRHPVLWSRAFFALTLLQGLVWGVFADRTLTLFDLSPTTLMLFICTGGLAAAAVEAFSPSLPLLITYLTALCGPITVAAFQSSSNVGASVAALTVLFLGMLIVSGRRASYEFWHSVSLARELEAERRRHATSMENARDEVRATSRTLAYVSREVRTPLSSIVGFAEELEAAPLDPAQRARLHALVESAEALQLTLGDLQDLSRLETGELALDQSPFDPCEVAERTVMSFRARAAAAGVRLRIEPATGAPRIVLGDAQRVRQVLSALVDRALRTSEGGDVVVSASSEATAADAGNGGVCLIALRVSASTAYPGSLDFDPGANGAEARDLLEVGPRVAHLLTRLMGGSLSSHHDAEHGVTATLTLELRAARTEDSGSDSFLNGKRILLLGEHEVDRTVLAAQLRSWGARVASLVLGAETLDLTCGDRDLVLIDADLQVERAIELAREVSGSCAHPVPVLLLSSVAPAAGEVPLVWIEKPTRLGPLREAIEAALRAGPRSARRPAVASWEERVPSGRVLLVDDDPMNRIVARTMLEKHGYEVIVAVNGREALESWRSWNPDLILMDVQMPNTDGFEATRRIREAESQSDRTVPIVALTANAMPGDRQRCIDAGMDDYIPKPFTHEALIEPVARWLAGRDSRTKRVA